MPRDGRTQKQLRIAIDTGGTFTDCVWSEGGEIRMLKVFSTPADPSQAILQALQQIDGSGGRLTLLHGTTVGTNTLLQRRGARVVLVTTAGFEDAIEIGRQARPKLYDFFFDRAEPLAAADMRFGLEERTGPDGQVLQAASEQELQALVETIRRKQPEAVAISLLFSFANPQNENTAARALRALGVPLSISHKILPEFREYERTSTVVINSYLQPVMQRYLERLERSVGKPGTTSSKGAGSRIFVMQSSGGITAIDSAACEPVRTVLSGPAGGIVGAAAMARRSGFERIISFDMGGTSTDVALVDREVRPSSRAEIAGLPIGVPMLDIHTVGAGGGSIARFDAAGALRVGPESAGADPGPICYGRGTQPTVTDANLILGRLQPRRFLGGDFVLDLERARNVTSEWLNRQQSKLTLEEFASGVIRVVNATMEKAIRVVSIERGYDPREFTLVAFGGAGGLHACELAEALGIPRIIVPARPGALSAFGILVSDVVKDYSRTVLWRVRGELPGRKLDAEFAQLRRTAAEDFRREGWSGAIRYRTSIDVRYRGQGYELSIPYTRGLLAAFQREHQRLYGHSYPNREVELVTVRLRATMKAQPLSAAPRTAAKKKSRAPLAEGPPIAAQSPVIFDAKKLPTAIHAREQLRSGKKYSGPAVVTEYSATTLVPPGIRFGVDQAENLIISR